MYLKFLQKPRCLCWFKTSQALWSAEKKTRLNSTKDNFIAKSCRLSTKRKLSILLNFLFPFVFYRRIFNLEIQNFSLENHHTIKVAEHSFGILWVYVICQIMARERLQLTSWNLASEKYTDERFWLTGKISSFRSFHGNMNDWIQPWNFTFAVLAKNSLIRFSYKLVHSLL